MKKFLGSGLLLLGLAAAGLAAERLSVPASQDDLEYFDHNTGGGLLEWVYPDYPAEPNADWEEERVRATFVVDVDGKVGEIQVLTGPERFRGPAVAALKQWKFKPALLDGRPIAIARVVNLPFKPTGTPARSIREDFFITMVGTLDPVPPGDPLNSEPIYPRLLESRRLAGEVELMLGITPEGRVKGVQVIEVTHPDFLTAALETVAQWECQPAHVGLMNVAGKKQAVLSFYTTDETGQDNHADWMERNGIFLREPADTKIVDYFDEPVKAVHMVDPVYPYSLAVAGTRGGARVNFTINPRGRVDDIVVYDATAPEFGQALAAAIAAWQFKPLQRHGESVGAEFSITWRFKEPAADSAEHRLLAATDPADQPVSARLLDRPLYPLFRRGAVFPAGRLDAGEAGQAEIEMIIDRDGRVRLPHVRGASQPEFGWSAATAVSQWLFETPLRDGKPVAVRVVIPVEFQAPAVAPNPLDKPEKEIEVERVPIQT